MCFKFYSNFYTQNILEGEEARTKDACVGEFLGKITLKLDERQQRGLERDFSLEDFEEAVKGLAK